MKNNQQNNLEEKDDTMPLKLFTLVFLKKTNPNKILLGYKTRGLGKGLWNGFGGKPERAENIFDCAKRELKEESNLMADNMKQIGLVRYDVYGSSESYSDIVHVFTSFEFHGEPRASDEMDPLKWYQFDEIPFWKMWPDAKVWYPHMLQDKYFSARVTYRGGKITETEVKEHDDLNEVLDLAEK